MSSKTQYLFKPRKSHEKPPGCFEEMLSLFYDRRTKYKKKRDAYKKYRKP